MLSCKDITELVTDYLEDRMSFMDKMRFQLHLGMCKHCRNYLKQMRQTIDTISELKEEDVPEHVMEELMERFNDWKKSPKA